MKLQTVTSCPACREGKVLQQNTGALVNCLLCHGWGLVTPKNICACGGSCTTIEDGFATCGSPECLKMFQESAKWQSYRHSGSYGSFQHRLDR